MKTHLAVALALLLAACTVADDREIWIEPAGPLVADGLFFVPRARNVSIVEVFIDGRSQDRFPANQAVNLPLRDVDYGQTVRLEVVGVGPEPAPHAETTVTKARESLLEVTPAAGLHETGQPLVVEAAFSLALREDQLGPGAVRLTRPFASAPSAQVREVALLDPRRVRVTLDRPIDADGEVSMELTVAARGGQPRPFQLGTWSVRDLRATVIARGFDPAIQPALASTFVDVEVAATGERPDLVELWSGSTRIAALDGPSPWSVRWDVTGQPEGTTPTIELRAPGRRVLRGNTWPEARIDHTAPVAGSCAARGTGGRELRRQSCIGAPLDQYVVGTPGLLAGGSPFPSEARIEGDLATGLVLWVCPLGTLPYGQVDLDLSALRDLAGNGLTGEVTCGGLTVPRWLAPLGRGPVRIAGAEVRAVSARATVLGSSSDWPPRPGAGLVWLGDGAIRRSEGDAEALPEGRVLAPGDGSSSANAFLTSAEEQVQAAAWVERDALGGDRVRAGLGVRGIDWITPGALSTSVAAGPAEPSAYASRWFVNQAWATWTEATAAGGRVTRAASFGPPPNDSDLGASGDGATTSTATAPSIYFLAGGFDAFLAWVEREGAGPARLRVASPRSPAWMDWGAPAEALVVDDATRPAVTAFDVVAPTVAWSSGGLLRLSSRNPDSGAWSPALVLNDDPAAAARAPRLDAPAVGGVAPSIAWIERSAQGDRILVRTRRAGTWELNPEAANADSAGEVAELAWGADTVTWVDGTGRVFVRLLNP